MSCTIVDERGQPLQMSEEKLEQWKQHFEKVLNVQKEVEANGLEDLEDHLRDRHASSDQGEASSVTLSSDIPSVLCTLVSS